MNDAAAVLLLTDDAMDAHRASGHPERPERRRAVAEGVRDAAWDRLAEEAPVGLEDEAILRVHDGDYLRALEALDDRGGGWLDGDTYVASGSMAAARLAAGATVRAAAAVADGDAAIGFAVVRPPGHHAARERGSGFCLLNNVVLAVASLRAGRLARRIAIVDWDVHHGDGTQTLTDDDPMTWYGSTHQVPLFPGTGGAGERGSGAAVGTKHNRPLEPGDGDDAFRSAWLDDLLPRLEAFGPEAIIVSAGYDAHRDDPLAHLRVTESGYRSVALGLGALARQLGLPGVALTLEGGYDLEALRASAAATVEGLLDGMATDR